MQIQASVDFDEVLSAFEGDNLTTPDRNDWPRGALKIANQQLGRWKKVMLSPDELGTIMLPQHDHGVFIVPPSGSTVAEAVRKLPTMDRSTEYYRRIQQFFDSRTSLIYLSAAPIDDPQYWDYKGIVDSGYRGLTHLDGLHRLFAWEQEARKRYVPAYVAGLPG